MMKNEKSNSTSPNLNKNWAQGLENCKLLKEILPFLSEEEGYF
ncbi:MAG: hypothetical protein ACYCQJ_00920 [Nitrososphaerales archaeon]